MEEAVAAGDIESIRFLLDEGHSPNAVPGSTPFLFLTEDPAIISLLLSYGADPKLPDEHGFFLTDYTEDPVIIEMLTAEKNIILAKPSKFTKYRGTLKSNTQRAKTRRRAPPAETPS